MVKTYSLRKDGNTRISPHFQVYEFASTYPSPYGNPWKLYSDNVLIDSDLIQILEELFNKLHASKCIISSGYRTPEHDKRVGGNGHGQHTLGLACDCTFYSQLFCISGNGNLSRNNSTDSTYWNCCFFFIRFFHDSLYCFSNGRSHVWRQSLLYF